MGAVTQAAGPEYKAESKSPLATAQGNRGGSGTGAAALIIQREGGAFCQCLG